jgi:hypothetical protein
MADHGSRTANYGFYRCGKIGRQVVIGDAIERSGAAPNAPGLWQNRLIASGYQSFAEIIEIVDATAS